MRNIDICKCAHIIRKGSYYFYGSFTFTLLVADSSGHLIVVDSLRKIAFLSVINRGEVLPFSRESRKIRCFTPANSDSSLITLGLSPFPTTLFHLTQRYFNCIFNAKLLRKRYQNKISFQDFRKNRLLIL